MGDKGVLSDLFLFKQLDDAIRREASGEGERQLQSPVDGKKKKVVVIKKAAATAEPPQLPGI
jgi:hypothetical protein